MVQQQKLAGIITPAEFRERPQYVLWVGFRLVWVIIALIGLFLTAVLAYLVWATPAVSVFGNPVTADSLALWQKASDVVFQRVTALLDQAVIKTLLPVLTLLLGYIFGTRAGQAPSPDQGDH